MNETDIDNLSLVSAAANTNAMTAQNQQQQYIFEEKERGLVEIQLEVDTIKEEIYHLLKQDQYRIKGGIGDWVEMEDKKTRTLSDWGVERIMQIIHFYINKNTLLSNFDEDQIKRLMLRFMKEVNDLVLLKYQVLFRQPTFEECKEIINERINNRVKMKMFSAEILGRNINEQSVKHNLMEEMERNLEMEMQKIRDEQRKEKIRDYGILIAQLEIIVYASLNRAYRGEERGSFRRHTSISEIMGHQPRMPNQNNMGKTGGFFSWGGK